MRVLSHMFDESDVTDWTFCSRGPNTCSRGCGRWMSNLWFSYQLRAQFSALALPLSEVLS